MAEEKERSDYTNLNFLTRVNHPSFSSKALPRKNWPSPSPSTLTSRKLIKFWKVPEAPLFKKNPSPPTWTPKWPKDLSLNYWKNMRARKKQQKSGRVLWRVFPILINFRSLSAPWRKSKKTPKINKASRTPRAMGENKNKKRKKLLWKILKEHTHQKSW